MSEEIGLGAESKKGEACLIVCNAYVMCKDAGVSGCKGEYIGHTASN